MLNEHHQVTSFNVLQIKIQQKLFCFYSCIKGCCVVQLFALKIAQYTVDSCRQLKAADIGHCVEISIQAKHSILEDNMKSYTEVIYLLTLVDRNYAMKMTTVKFEWWIGNSCIIPLMDYNKSSKDQSYSKAVSSCAIYSACIWSLGSSINNLILPILCITMFLPNTDGESLCIE